jgi:hypothetical protein
MALLAEKSTFFLFLNLQKINTAKKKRSNGFETVEIIQIMSSFDTVLFAGYVLDQSYN